MPLIDLKKKILASIKPLFIRDIMDHLDMIEVKPVQKGSDYGEWLDSNLLKCVDGFIFEHNILASVYITNMSRNFKTKRFENYLKRRLSEYMYKLFNILHDSSANAVSGNSKIYLEDNPLNRYAIKKYADRFNARLEINWKSPPNGFWRCLAIIFQNIVIIFKSINTGLKLCVKRKSYKVMREAGIGLYDIGGYYGQDDFFVDGDILKERDCIFFSRGIPADPFRLKGYHDFRRSNYAHVNLYKLPISLKTFIDRIAPKYIILGSLVMLREIQSPMFSLFLGNFSYFINWALIYEKFFSNYKVVSEYGQAYYSSRHIIESIICQNYGTKYYLGHWSDNSVVYDRYLLSSLGCDKFLLWGEAHLHGVEGDPSILLSIGYINKRFINQVKRDRSKVLRDMGIKERGKIISFFDESFGGECMMTEDHYVGFWEVALTTALKEKDHTIVIKPKELNRYKNLSSNLMGKYIKIRQQLNILPNVYIIDEIKWSFVEAIGIADVVITQGMTSSATIALICGIEGLYFDQSTVDHLFCRKFKDKLVFDDPEKLISMINRIVIGKESPLKDIPEEILRSFDAYADDRGIDIFRKILAGAEY